MVYFFSTLTFYLFFRKIIETYLPEVYLDIEIALEIGAN